MTKYDLVKCIHDFQVKFWDIFLLLFLYIINSLFLMPMKMVSNGHFKLKKS